MHPYGITSDGTDLHFSRVLEAVKSQGAPGQGRAVESHQARPLPRASGLRPAIARLPRGPVKEKVMANPQKIQATVTEIASHGSGVYTLRFAAERTLPRFKPGQFMHLALDDYDPSTGFWPESRVFSIAAAAGPTEVLISYSVKGAYTSRMERELRPGSGVWLKYPYGSFIINEAVGEAGPAVLVAGGTGITPFVSFLDKEAELRSQRPMALFYGARNAALLLYPDLIKRAIESCPNLQLHLFIEEPGSAFGLPAAAGRLSAVPILDAHRNLAGAPIFLAGPPLMMDLFKGEFLSAGISPEAILMDEWE